MRIGSYVFGKRFTCGHITDKWACHEYIGTSNPVKEGQRVILLEAHTGPCSCSYCHRRHPWWKLSGPGWRIIAFRTFRARWYLRWTSSKVWKGYLR